MNRTTHTPHITLHELIAHCALRITSPWLLLVTAILIVTVKLALIDRFDTPFRHANLVDGRLRSVDVPAAITFSDHFVLLGYDTLPARVASGEWFEVKTYWRAVQAGRSDYGVTINVVDSQGHRWNGSDIRTPRWHRTPAPVWRWPPDQYALVALSVPLLPGTPPGTYAVEVVAFDRDTLAPLTAHDAGGTALGPALPLGQITVTAPRQPAGLDELGIHDPLDVSFGPLTLLGTDFDRDQAAPGDSVLVTTFWRAGQRPLEDLTAHLALLAADGSSAAEVDFPPTVPWHPTSAWNAGDVWRGQRFVRLPARLESGEYRWALRLCRATETACQGAEPETVLGTLQVHAPARIWAAPPLDVETDTPLGDVVTLLGGTFQPALPALQPGSAFTVTLAWRAEAETDTSYRVFLHLLGPGGTLVAQSDGEPANWTRPTTGWLPGEVVLDERVMAIPGEAFPGEYALQAGMYTLEGGRLRTPDGSDAVRLATVTLTAR